MQIAFPRNKPHRVFAKAAPHGQRHPRRMSQTACLSEPDDGSNHNSRGDNEKSQVGLIVAAVSFCLVLIIMAFREVERGDQWHQQSRIAAKRIREDEAHLIPLLYHPGIEMTHTPEEGDKYVVGDQDGAPIDHWLAGAAGAEQKLAASYDIDPDSKPQPLVHLPERHSDGGLVDPGRKAWGSLDFRADEETQQALVAQEAAQEAAERQKAQEYVSKSTPQDPRQAGGVEVKKLMTSKTFQRWKHCVDYYTPAKLTNNMMQIIENGDLGKAPQQVVQAMQSLQRLGCVFFTQNCIKPNRPELVTPAQTKVFTDREYKALPPALPRKGLGSCAIVGHSDRLLGQTRGKEIDEHTTVIRVGFFLRQPGTPPLDVPSAPPIEGFEFQVGSKTDFVYLPTRRVFTAPHMQSNQKTTMWHTPEWQVLHSDGRKKQLAGRGKYEQVIGGVGKHIYGAFQSTKLKANWREASDELHAVMWWLASGLCSSIDVYGMAFPHQTGETHSRAYWSTANKYEESTPWPGPQVSQKSAALEMYAMHAAMQAGLLCIHTN